MKNEKDRASLSKYGEGYFSAELTLGF
jgi:hypothetical protein